MQSMKWAQAQKKGALNPQGLVGIFIAIIIGVLALQFFLGQTDEIVSLSNDVQGNVTGTADTVAEQFPLFWILGGFVMVVAIAFGAYKAMGGGK